MIRAVDLSAAFDLSATYSAFGIVSYILKTRRDRLLLVSWLVDMSVTKQVELFFTYRVSNKLWRQSSHRGGNFIHSEANGVQCPFLLLIHYCLIVLSN